MLTPLSGRGRAFFLTKILKGENCFFRILVTPPINLTRRFFSSEKKFFEKTKKILKKKKMDEEKKREEKMFHWNTLILKNKIIN